MLRETIMSLKTWSRKLQLILQVIVVTITTRASTYSPLLSTTVSNSSKQARSLKKLFETKKQCSGEFLKSVSMEAFRSRKLCRHMWVYRTLNWFLYHTYSKNKIPIYANLSQTWSLNLLGMLWKTDISWDSVVSPSHLRFFFFKWKSKTVTFYLALAEHWSHRSNGLRVLMTREAWSEFTLLTQCQNNICFYN